MAPCETEPLSDDGLGRLHLAPARGPAESRSKARAGRSGVNAVGHRIFACDVLATPSDKKVRGAGQLYPGVACPAPRSLLYSQLAVTDCRVGWYAIVRGLSLPAFLSGQGWYDEGPLASARPARKGLADQSGSSRS